MKEKLIAMSGKISEGLVFAGLVVLIAVLVAINGLVGGLVSSARGTARFGKRNKKKLISAGLVIVLIAGYILGTGFTFVQPNTVKVVQEPAGYLNGEIIYTLIPHVNEGENTDFVWKWLMYPEFWIESKDLSLNIPSLSFKIPVINKEVSLGGWQITIPLKWPEAQWAQMGQTKEVIDLKDLNFEHKMVLWTLDEETGNPEDRNTVVVAVISGKLVIDDWQAFVNNYRPDEFNAELKEKNPSAPDFNTIEYWSEQELKPYISAVLNYLYGSLLRDMPYRFQLAKNLLENETLNLETRIAVENYLRENYPWVWVEGVQTVSYFFSNPEKLMPLVQAGSEEALALYIAMSCDVYLAQVPYWLSWIETVENNFYRLTKPSLVEEAEVILKEFNQYLEERNRNLASHSQETLDLEIEQFLTEKTGYTEDGKLAFLNLVEYKWIRAVVLFNKEYAEKLLKEMIIPYFQQHPRFNGELNVYAWEEAIKAALDSPDEDPGMVGRKLTFKILRHPVLWERVNEFLSQKYGKAYIIEDISVKLEERPLFDAENQVDKDFFMFYEFYLKDKDKK